MYQFGWYTQFYPENYKNNISLFYTCNLKNPESLSIPTPLHFLSDLLSKCFFSSLRLNNLKYRSWYCPFLKEFSKANWIFLIYRVRIFLLLETGFFFEFLWVLFILYPTPSPLPAYNNHMLAFHFLHIYLGIFKCLTLHDFLFLCDFSQPCPQSCLGFLRCWVSSLLFLIHDFFFLVVLFSSQFLYFVPLASLSPHFSYYPRIIPYLLYYFIKFNFLECAK